MKVRIQVAAATGSSISPLSVGWKIVETEGFSSLYTGLSAGLMRQVLYTGSRLGLYDKFTAAVKEPGQALPLHKTAACAIGAGGIAALICNPADLALIRMQTDALLPTAEQRGYKNVFSALSSILRSEGPMGMLKGAGPTATRAMGLNLGMLGGNSEVRGPLTASFTGQDAPTPPRQATWCLPVGHPVGRASLIISPASARSHRPRSTWVQRGCRATRSCWARPPLPASSPPPSRYR